MFSVAFSELKILKNSLTQTKICLLCWLNNNSFFTKTNIFSDRVLNTNQLIFSKNVLMNLTVENWNDLFETRRLQQSSKLKNYIGLCSVLYIWLVFVIACLFVFFFLFCFISFIYFVLNNTAFKWKHFQQIKKGKKRKMCGNHFNKIWYVLRNSMKPF